MQPFPPYTDQSQMQPQQPQQQYSPHHQQQQQQQFFAHQHQPQMQPQPQQQPQNPQFYQQPQQQPGIIRPGMGMGIGMMPQSPYQQFSHQQPPVGPAGLFMQQPPPQPQPQPQLHHQQHQGLPPSVANLFSAFGGTGAGQQQQQPQQHQPYSEPSIAVSSSQPDPEDESIDHGTILTSRISNYSLSQHSQSHSGVENPLVTSEIGSFARAVDNTIGRVIAVNPDYIVYTVASGLIRVLSRNSSKTGLLKGHSNTGKITDIYFQSPVSAAPVSALLSSISSTGECIIWQLKSTATEIGFTILLKLQLESNNQSQYRLKWRTNNSTPQIALITENTINIIDLTTAFKFADKDRIVNIQSIAAENLNQFCSRINRTDNTNITDCCWTTDGSLLAVSNNIGIVQLYSIDSKLTDNIQPKLIDQLVIHSDKSIIDRVIFIPNSNTTNNTVDELLLIASKSCTELTLIHLPTRTVLSRLTLESGFHEPVFNVIEISNNGEFIFISYKASDPQDRPDDHGFYCIHLFKSINNNLSESRFDYITPFNTSLPIVSFCLLNAAATNNNESNDSNNTDSGIDMFCCQTKPIVQYHLNPEICYKPVDQRQLIQEQTTQLPPFNTTAPAAESTTADEQKSTNTSTASSAPAPAASTVPMPTSIKSPTKAAPAPVDTGLANSSATGLMTPDSFKSAAKSVSKPTLSTATEPGKMKIMQRPTLTANNSNSNTDSSSSSASLASPIVPRTPLPSPITPNPNPKSLSIALSSPAPATILENNNNTFNTSSTANNNTPIQTNPAIPYQTPTPSNTPIVSNKLNRTQSTGSSNFESASAQPESKPVERITANAAAAAVLAAAKMNRDSVELNDEIDDNTSSSNSSSNRKLQQESNLLTRLEKLFTKHFNKVGAVINLSLEQQKSARATEIESESQQRLISEKQRMEQLLRLMSQTVNSVIPTHIESVFKSEIERLIVPAIEESVSNITTTAPSIDTTVLSESIINSLKPLIASEFKSTFTGTLLPAFQTSTRLMFNQITDTFNKLAIENQSKLNSNTTATNNTNNEISELKSLVQSLAQNNNLLQQQIANLQQQQQQSNKELKLLIQSIADNTANLPSTVAAAAASAAGSISNSPARTAASSPKPIVDPKIEIHSLLSNSQFDAAFTTALSTADLSIVLWLCSSLDPRVLLSTTVKSHQLSAPVILSLMQQLGFQFKDNSNSSNNSNSIKLNWIKECAMNLMNEKSNPIIIDHIPIVATTVLNNLDQQLTNIMINDPLFDTVRMIKQLLAVLAK